MSEPGARIAHMFDYPDLNRLDAAAALGVLEAAQRARRHAEVTEALATLRVVHAYRHQIATDKVRLAGDGTARVDDFACLELAAALHRPAESVTAEVVDLLNLEGRLPRLWEVVVACGVPVWQARRVARATAGLSLARCLWVDATIAPFLTRLGPGRLARFVEALVVQADPDAARARWERAGRPRLDLGPFRDDGLRELYGLLDAADAVYLGAALDQLSGILAEAGDLGDAAERRAAALGVLATPARALALIQHSLAQPALTDGGLAAGAPTSPSAPAPHGSRSPFGCAGHACGRITLEPDRLLPRARLVIHLSDDTLTTGVGVGRSEQLGPVTIDQLRRLLGHTRVQVLPVFNPNGIVPADSYEIPERVRRAVLLRHPYDIFPYGSRTTSGTDLDHTRPFRWGERWRPGQTGPDNLGPLRRKGHRAKTHAGWQLTQPRPGRFVWRSPLGRSYTVTQAGLTTDTHHPPGSRPWDHPLGGPLLPDPPAPTLRRRTAARPILRR